MQIQKLELPQGGEQEREQLYIRCLQGAYQTEEQSLKLEEKTLIRFDTYFNACSVEKWLTYTKIQDLFSQVRVKGRGILRIWNEWESPSGGIERKLLAEKQFETEAEELFEISLLDKMSTAEVQGMLYTEIETGEGQRCVLSEGGYTTSTVSERTVHLVIAICTYKRETYVTRNLEIIRKKLWENPRSPLYQNIHVIVADNGRTLEKHADKSWLTICPNKNAGGAAGFARGMAEALKDDSTTHVLLMDDDVEIKPSAIEKTYLLLALLKDEYRERIIGGAMLRSDYTFVQQESGGSYQGGRIQSIHAGMDLRRTENVLLNERNERADYNAWWYCCIPVSVIKKKGFPLPVFLHCDDVEYGLRTGTEPIRMNGICVWHDAFEHKRPSVNEYYDVRNTLIVNGLYVRGYGGRQAFRMVCRRMLVNLFRYRYKDIRLIARAVDDYLRGPGWLMQTDAEELHRELMSTGYQYTEIFSGTIPEKEDVLLTDILAGKHNLNNIDRKKLLSLNGWLLPARRGNPEPIMAGESPHCYYRKKDVWIYDPDTKLGFYSHKEMKQLFEMPGEWFRLWLKLKKEYATAQRAYQNAIAEMTSMEFWNQYLKEKGDQL